MERRTLTIELGWRVRLGRPGSEGVDGSGGWDVQRGRPLKLRLALFRPGEKCLVWSYLGF